MQNSLFVCKKDTLKLLLNIFKQVDPLLNEAYSISFNFILANITKVKTLILAIKKQKLEKSYTKSNQIFLRRVNKKNWSQIGVET
jgi:hypothetical protein